MNPLLQKTQTDIVTAMAKQMKTTPDKLAPSINRVVDAGKAFMYSDKSEDGKPSGSDLTRQALIKADDPEEIGAAAAKLGAILFNQSKKGLPIEILVPALVCLMCEALQFLEDAGAVKITPDFLAQTTQATMSAFMQVMGISQEQVAAQIEKAQKGKPGAPQPQPPQQPAPGGIMAAAQGGA